MATEVSPPRLDNFKLSLKQDHYPRTWNLFSVSFNTHTHILNPLLRACNQPYWTRTNTCTLHDVLPISLIHTPSFSWILRSLIWPFHWMRLHMTFLTYSQTLIDIGQSIYSISYFPLLLLLGFSNFFIYFSSKKITMHSLIFSSHLIDRIDICIGINQRFACFLVAFFSTNKKRCILVLSKK